MTTNEKMNRGRYRHFQENRGKSPFTRGPFHNFIDFFNISFFGIAKPVQIDWMNYFDLHKNIEHEPLLTTSENFQFI